MQATDEYVGVKNARIVLADDIGVRATMTASWLVQMGWRDVFVLEGGLGSGPFETGQRSPVIVAELGGATMTTDGLAEVLDEVCIVDLGPSPGYERGHIPGAWWCVRARLAEALERLPSPRRIVLTSPDGRLAEAALEETRRLAPCPVEALDGGTDRWIAEGRETESGLERTIGDLDDVWFKPYEHRDAQEKFMREYLTWEVALVEQIERDGTARFKAY